MPTIEQIVQDKLTAVCDALDVPVDFVANEQDQNQVRPAYRPDDMFSKLISLFVFSGINVPVSFAPPYNRVHADVEFWKTRMNELQKEKEEKPNGTDQPQ